MRKTRSVAALLAVIILGAAQYARAASFTISGGIDYVTPPDVKNPTFPWWGNQVIPGTPGFLGAQLEFQGTADLAYDISFEFVGAEALWVDMLHTSGGDIDNRQPPGTVVAVRWRATGGLDLIPFAFVNGDVPPRSVANGSNVLPTIAPAEGQPNFFLAIAGPAGGAPTGREGETIWVAFDDNGAGPDVDHDDWVGLVKAQPAPEPAALVLLAGGFLALSRRLRRSRRTRG